MGEQSNGQQRDEFNRPKHAAIDGSHYCYFAVLFSVACRATSTVCGATVALWLFDEQVGLYPSCVLGDAATNDCPLVLGPGGQIVKGKFGNALEPSEHQRSNSRSPTADWFRAAAESLIRPEKCRPWIGRTPISAR